MGQARKEVDRKWNGPTAIMGPPASGLTTSIPAIIPDVDKIESVIRRGLVEHRYMGDASPITSHCACTACVLDHPQHQARAIAKMVVEEWGR